MEIDPASIEERVKLTLVGLQHELIECDPALADTAAFCAHYGYPENQSANTILVASKKPPGEHAVCVVLAPTRLDVNNRVRKLLGVRKVSFASAEVTAEITGMLLGGVTPFGLPPGLPVWIDARVVEPAWVILGGGSRSLKIKVAPAVLAGLPGAEVVDDLAVVPERA